MQSDTEAAVETKCPQGAGFVDRLVREFFVERFCAGKWHRNGVGARTLAKAKEWAADPIVPAMASLPVRIVQVDTSITETIIPFPNSDSATKKT